MLTTCPVCRLVRSVGNAGVGAPCAHHPAPLDPYRLRVRRGVVRFEPVQRDVVPISIRATALMLTLLAVLGALSASHLPQPVTPHADVDTAPEPVRAVVPVAEEKPRKTRARAAELARGRR